MTGSDVLAMAVQAVARLEIEHPDPDRYDAVWNTAIARACAEIRGVRLTDDTPPEHRGRTPLQRALYALIASRGPIDEGPLQALAFPTLPPSARPRIGAALGALQRSGLIRRLAGGRNRYVIV